MSLSTILKDIETNKPAADMDINSGSLETRNGRLGLKRAAADAISRLKLQYRKELMRSTVFIVVTGSQANAFSEQAGNENFGCFVSDPDAFFKDMASKINPSLYGRESTKNLFNIVSNVLEDKALSLDIQSYPMLMFNEKYNLTVKSADEFVPVLRRAVVDQVGSELVGLNAIFSIVDTAIQKGHTAPVTPVVLNTADEKFALDMQKNLQRLTPHVYLVIAGKGTKPPLASTPNTLVVKNVNESSVGEALESIRTKVIK